MLKSDICDNGVHLDKDPYTGMFDKFILEYVVKVA